MNRSVLRQRVLASAILWLAIGCPHALIAETPDIGNPAPDFQLPGVDGKTYKLESFKDAEILVIVFTCNHCPTAQAYEDRIKHLAAEYKDRKVAVVAISPNDPQAVRLDELGYSDLGDSFDDMKTGGVVGPHYAASKAGILGLTHSYANLLAKEGITVNAIARPGSRPTWSATIPAPARP